MQVAAERGSQPACTNLVWRRYPFGYHKQRVSFRVHNLAANLIPPLPY